MKYLSSLFKGTGSLNIRMTQNYIDKSKVNSIKKSMFDNKYDFDDPSNKIAYEIYDDVYYITEGHHRMQAALEVWVETNDYSCVENLIYNAIGYKINKKPISFRFKL